jgi:PAS domain S-box-containing protein
MSVHPDSNEDWGMYKSIFETSLDAILLTKLDGSILAANPSAEEMFDMSQAEIVAAGIDELVVQDEALNSAISERSHKGRVKAELTFIRKDGSLFPGEITSTLFTDDDGIVRANVSIRDISDGKHSEKQMEYSPYLLSLVNDSVIGVDSNFRINYWNKGAEEMYGWSESEALGKTTIELLRPDYAPNEREKIIHDLVHENLSKATINTLHQNGSQVIIEVNLIRIINDSGDTSGYFFVHRDVTEREKLEKELKESENKYRNLTEFSTDYIYVFDKNLHFVYMNNQALKFAGKKPDEIIGKGLKDIFPPEVSKHMKKSILSVFDSGETFSREAQYDLPIGVQWLNTSLIPIKDADSNINFVMGISRDITQYKLVEMDLKEREEHLELLTDNMNDLILQIDEKGIITYSSPSLNQLSGFKPHEVVGKNAFDFVHPDEQEKIINVFQKAISAKRDETIELRIKKSDDNYIWVEASGKPVYDRRGNFEAVVLVIRDISRRKKVERKLKKTLDNLEELVEQRTKDLTLLQYYNRNLFDTAFDPLVTIDLDGKITDVNVAAEEITGYSRYEIIGSCFLDFFINPEDAMAVYQHILKEGFIKGYSLEIKNKDGTITPVLYNAILIKDCSGEVTGIFAATHDITDVKKAENKLKEYWESLEEEVKQRTEELAKSNADLKQFTYIASHDLREPLRMITTFLQLLERRYKDQLDDDALEFIGYAVDGAKRLDKMIMDLLEYSRVANIELMFNDIDVEEVIDKLMLNLNVLINENTAIITHDKLPILRADENQMILLFQNLIANSIKYRSDKQPEIHVSAFKEGNHYVFRVEDNGIGIDPKHFERIFTIFQRLHPHEEYEGSGIGLSIAQRIVHQHGGEIWLESEPGIGSAFCFTIKTQ